MAVVVLWSLSAASKAATWNRRGQAAPAGLALACEEKAGVGVAHDKSAEGAWCEQAAEASSTLKQAC